MALSPLYAIGVQVAELASTTSHSDALSIPLASMLSALAEEASFSQPWWWLNQPIWKICSSKWVDSSSPIFGVKIKNIYIKPPPSNDIATHGVVIEGYRPGAGGLPDMPSKRLVNCSGPDMTTWQCKILKGKLLPQKVDRYLVDSRVQDNLP